MPLRVRLALGFALGTALLIAVVGLGHPDWAAIAGPGPKRLAVMEPESQDDVLRFAKDFYGSPLTGRREHRVDPDHDDPARCCLSRCACR